MLHARPGDLAAGVLVAARSYLAIGRTGSLEDAALAPESLESTTQLLVTGGSNSSTASPSTAAERTRTAMESDRR